MDHYIIVMEFVVLCAFNRAPLPLTIIGWSEIPPARPGFFHQYARIKLHLVKHMLKDVGRKQGSNPVWD